MRTGFVSQFIGALVTGVALLSLCSQASDAQQIFENARGLPNRGGQLGIEYNGYDSPDHDGPRPIRLFEIVEVDCGGSLYKRLEQGDVIVALDNYYFRSDGDFGAYISSKRPGDIMRVRYMKSETDVLREVTVQVVNMQNILLGAFICGMASSPGGNSGNSGGYRPDLREHQQRQENNDRIRQWNQK